MAFGMGSFFKLKVDVEVMLSLTYETLFLWVYK